MKPRVHQLDAARGLLALGVLVYHVVPGTPWPFGTYGVYAFFVLSGFALDHVYRERFTLRGFALARVARLAPLWVPVVLVSAFLYGITDPARIALNLTGLFGFVHPGATSIVTGGWSIGIEVGCYALFPLLRPLSTRTLAVVTVGLLALRYGYALLVWRGSLAEAWVPYTELPSFVGFFALGMLWSRHGIRSRWTGNRARAATLLGDLSYGTYLLHPIVAWVAGPVALLTPVLALVVFRWYEVPAGRWLRGDAAKVVVELRPDGLRGERAEGVLADRRPVQ